jgi:hypothetical protein
MNKLDDEKIEIFMLRRCAASQFFLQLSAATCSIVLRDSSRRGAVFRKDPRPYLQEGKGGEGGGGSRTLSLFSLFALSHSSAWSLTAVYSTASRHLSAVGKSLYLSLPDERKNG